MLEKFCLPLHNYWVARFCDKYTAVLHYLCNQQEFVCFFFSYLVEIFNHSKKMCAVNLNWIKINISWTASVSWPYIVRSVISFDLTIPNLQSDIVENLGLYSLKDWNSKCFKQYLIQHSNTYQVKQKSRKSVTIWN